ncbi:hypothetical protein [Actinopolymorpha alba]|uniref:hypothetical protein n=1 Tax=Actinopolymorpha alba TaxID=533267 RepID=UPI00036398BE|nr:hypothetical protein [Actinopolymorpha alba]
MPLDARWEEGPRTSYDGVTFGVIPWSDPAGMTRAVVPQSQRATVISVPGVTGRGALGV